MAHIPLSLAPHDIAFGPTARPQKRGLFQKILDAIIASQQRRADIEIARFLHGRGKLTDEAEREIERRFLLPPGNAQANGSSR